MKNIIILSYNNKFKDYLKLIAYKYNKIYILYTDDLLFKEEILAIKSIFENVIFIKNYHDITEDINEVIVLNTTFRKVYLSAVICMKYFITLNVEITCFMKLKNHDLNLMNILSKKYKVKFNYLTKNLYYLDEIQEDYLRVNNKIVIGIGKLFNEIDSIPLIEQCLIRLRKIGYKTEVISNSKLGKYFFGFNVFPDSFGKDTKPVPLQIIDLKNYIMDLCLKSDADILLVDFPDSIIKFSNKIVNNYGIYSYLLSQAVSFDYFVLTLPIMPINTDYFNELNNYCKYHLGTQIDGLLFYKKLLNIYDNENDNKNLIDLPDDKIIQITNELVDIDFSNKYFQVDNDYILKLVDDMISKLAENINIL